VNFDQVQVEYHVLDKQRIALMISAYQPNQQGFDLLRLA